MIFDTTLRDGEQCPGASMTPKEKLEVARQLARLRVDVIPTSWIRPSALGMRLVLFMQKTGLLKLFSPSASHTLAQATATGIEEGLFSSWDEVRVSTLREIREVLTKAGAAGHSWELAVSLKDFNPSDRERSGCRQWRL